MIVQAGRSISGLNDRRARPTSRSLNYPTRLHTQSKIQTFSGQSWCVWDGGITTSQRAATKAPLRPRETSARVADASLRIPSTSRALSVPSEKVADGLQLHRVCCQFGFVDIC